MQEWAAVLEKTAAMTVTVLLAVKAELVETWVKLSVPKIKKVKSANVG